MSNGQGNVMWSARARVVWLGFRAQSHIVAAVFAPPALAALAEGAWALGAALLLAVALAGAGALAARTGEAPPPLRDVEGAAVLVFLFLAVAVLSVPGFVALGLSPLDALFEGVSAVTSTGLSVATGTMDWPLAGHLLRGWMQWAGGFAIAVAGIALILGPGGGQAKGAAASLGQAGLSERDLLSSTRAQARALLAVYSAITVLAVVLLVPLMPTWWEAVVIALSAVSTGGFTPRPDSLAGYGAPAQAVTLAICVATAVSLLFYIVLRRAGPRAALAQTHAGATLAVFAGGTGLVTLLASGTGAGGAGIRDAALNFLSGATTAGFSVGPVSDVPAVTAIILTGMAIGGGIGSTAGGVKVDRVLVFARSVGVSAMRMRAPPRAVTVLSERGRAVDPDRLIGMAAVLFLYAATLIGAWVIFLALGAPALPALFDVVSALSTAGLSSGLTGPDLAPGLKTVLIAAMLLGRLEFLALLVVLSPRTWAVHPMRPLHPDAKET